VKQLRTRETAHNFEKTQITEPEGNAQIIAVEPAIAQRSTNLMKGKVIN